MPRLATADFGKGSVRVKHDDIMIVGIALHLAQIHNAGSAYAICILMPYAFYNNIDTDSTIVKSNKILILTDRKT